MNDKSWDGEQLWITQFVIRLLFYNMCGLHTKCNILFIGELELIIIFAAYPSCRRSNSYIINMKKLLLLVCIAWTGQCVSVVSAQSSSKSIYKKGWIDFNKNGVKDIFEDPSQPVEKAE